MCCLRTICPAVLATKAGVGRRNSRAAALGVTAAPHSASGQPDAVCFSLEVKRSVIWKSRANDLTGPEHGSECVIGQSASITIEVPSPAVSPPFRTIVELIRVARV